MGGTLEFLQLFFIHLGFQLIDELFLFETFSFNFFIDQGGNVLADKLILLDGGKVV